CQPGEGSDQGSGEKRHSRPRSPSSVSNHVRGRLRRAALASEGTERAGNPRARDQMAGGQAAVNAPEKVRKADPESGIRRLNMIEAINDALDVMLERDPDVIVMGEDIGYFGGVFRCTAGLQDKHGKTRVFDTPISECGIIGAAVGMCAYGLRPVPEIQFADYIYPGLDQLVSEAARLRYRSAGEFIAPMTVRSPFGGGIFGGQTHSQSPEALFTHVAGIKTVVPS